MEELDDIFELLTKERRRFVLYYLEDQSSPVSISELARKIEEWETGSPPAELPDEKYQDIMLTLKHQHLPKAAQVEYIEYDPDQNTIELTGTPAEVSVILSVAEAIEQPHEDDIIHIT